MKAKYERLYRGGWGQAYELQPSRAMRYHFVKKELDKVLKKRNRVSLESNRIKNALDIGCGAGDIVDYLSCKGLNSFGFDLSQKAIKIARKTKKGRFSVSGINNFKTNKKFDLIVNVDVIEHIKDDGSAIKKMSSLLDDNGVLLLSTVHRQFYWNWLDKEGGHYKRYSKKGLKEKLEREGLKIKKIYSYGFPFAALYYIFKGFLIRPGKESELLGKAGRSKLDIFLIKVLQSLFKINLGFSLGNQILVVAEKGRKREKKVSSKIYDETVAGQDEQFHIEHYYRPKYRIFKTRIERVLKAINPQMEESLLDLGCGVGTFAYYGAQRGTHSYGVDYSATTIRAANKLAKKFKKDVKGSIKFVKADCTKLPFDNDSFDKIISADFFEHINRYQKVKTLSEMNRVLKPEGKMVIYTPNRNLQILYVGLLKLFAIMRGKNPSKHTLESLNPEHIGLITPAEMKRLLKRENLDFKIRLFSREFTSNRILNSLTNFLFSKIPFVNKFLSERILVEAYKK